MEITALKVGDTVYLRKLQRSRYDNSPELEEYQIKTVGRKYLSVWKDAREYSIQKFDMTHNFKHENGGYSPSWRLYFTELEYELEKEKDILVEKVRRAFNSWSDVGRYSLDKLRRISAIIDEN